MGKYVVSLIFAASLLLAGCEKGQVTVAPTVEGLPTPVVLVATQEPFTEPTSFLEVGPEATPSVSVSYPTSLSVEEILTLLDGGGALPDGFNEDPEVSALVDTRTNWLRQAGLNVDDASRDDYVIPTIITWGQGDSFRWDVVPKDKSGNIVGWLQISDVSIETGWRFAESPSWDPNFDPNVDQYRFDLPEKLFAGNLFEVILVGGEYKVLVEVDHNGMPLRWLNALQQEMRLAAGVEIPEQYRVLETGVAQELVGGQWQEVALPEIPESLEPTVILGENGLFQVKVQLTNFETPDGLVIGEYVDGEWRPVSFAFLRSPEVTQEILGMYKGYFREESKRNPVNGFVEYRMTGVLQGMKLEVDEVSGQTHLTMLMIVYNRLVKLVPDVNALANSAFPEGERYDSSKLTVAQIANLVRISETQLIKARFFDDSRQRVYFIAVFWILTDQVTEFYCHGNAQLPGFNDWCFETLLNEDRKIKTLADFESLLYRSRLSLTPETVDSGIDWWDDDLIKPVSSQDSIYVATSLLDLTGGLE